MSRIFMSLSILPAMLVIVTMGVGWWIGDYNGAHGDYLALSKEAARNPDTISEEQVLAEAAKLKEPRRRFTIHFQLGLATALAVTLINSLSVTYLIGTSRWIKEVCDAYELDEKYVNDSKRIKRSTFPWSIMGVLSIIMIVAFGAASDPGTGIPTTAQWVSTHLIVAMAGTAVIIIAIFVQASNLQVNADIINQVVEDVRREREARGLPVE